MTADDFVYSWRRLADPKTASPYGSYLASAYVLNAAAINAGSKPPSELGVKALDAHTLQVTLSEPNSYLLKQLVHFRSCRLTARWWSSTARTGLNRRILSATARSASASGW